jgi:peptidoglycan/LPS O-acetylase OafA/YrhL
LSAAETLVTEAFEPPPAEAPAEPPPRATLLNIQSLRALAALMVVFVHIEALAVMAGGRAEALDFGNGGVDLFFVISGFIMVFTTGRKPMGPMTFLAARWRRIAPLYWSVTLAVFALAMLAPRLLQNTQADLPHLIASLLFLPLQRADGTMRPVVFVGWTLNLEMAFYVLFAAGLMFRRRVLGVALTFGALLALAAWAQWARPADPVLLFYTTPMVLEFGFGMLLGLAWPYLPRSRAPALALGAAAVAAFVLILAAPTLWPGAERMLIYGLPAAVIVAAALTLERSGLALRWAWTRQLGNASYAIYLSHVFVTQAVILAAARLHLHGALAAALLAVVALAGVAAAGLGLHYAVERPLDALLGALKCRYAPLRLAAGRSSKALL